jgi:hypothetical protein
MEICCQTDFKIDRKPTKNKIKPSGVVEERHFQNLSTIDELPSIHKHKRGHHSSKNSQSPKANLNHLDQKIRLPSIFKRYAQVIES